MRPAIDGWFDSQIRIWRPSVVRDALNVETRIYAPIGIVGAAINRSKTRDVPQSGGLQEAGSLRWYGEPLIDVHVRDVCEVIVGPDESKVIQWEIDSEPVHPRGHHTQVDCIAWTGKLPSLEPLS
jgi:hypothetical protein